MFNRKTIYKWAISHNLWMMNGKKTLDALMPPFQPGLFGPVTHKLRWWLQKRWCDTQGVQRKDLQLMEFWIWLCLCCVDHSILRVIYISIQSHNMFCVYIYIFMGCHTHTHTYIHTCMHAYIHTYIYIYIYIQPYIYIYTYTHTSFSGRSQRVYQKSMGSKSYASLRMATHRAATQAQFVCDALTSESDLGDISAEILRQCLQRCPAAWLVVGPDLLGVRPAEVVMNWWFYVESNGWYDWLMISKRGEGLSTRNGWDRWAVVNTGRSFTPI